VIVRRAFTVSNEAGLSYAIDTINNAIANNESYITILITKDINLTGANQRNITSAWKGKNIILEKNSTASVVTVGGLIVEGSGAVALKDVNIVNITIVAGYYNSFALRSDGKLWASGYNDFGQLGLGNNVSKTSFESVTISGLPSGAKIVSIAAGGFHSLALDSEGGVWASGYNDFGQLGLSNNVSKTSFVKVTSLSDKNITAITAGYYHSLALDNNGKVWASGYDNDGQLGLGDTNGKNVFTEVSLSGKIITAIAAGAGGHHSLALDSNGGVWASGYNEAGQLGLRDTNKRTSFEQVTINTLPSNAKIVSIAVNHVHSLALDSNGGVWASGLHDRGQLGLGNDINQNEFKSVIINGLTSGAKIVSISAGGIHSLALDDDGKLWATGDNTYGQLALGNNVSKASFQSVAISAKIVSVSGGAFYSLALTNDGVLLGAGHNGAGELGLGGVFRTTVFTPISF
jgi:alpha-tubulin suppressor-like RCC1 family protein